MRTDEELSGREEEQSKRSLDEWQDLFVNTYVGRNQSLSIEVLWGRMLEEVGELALPISQSISQSIRYHVPDILGWLLAFASRYFTDKPLSEIVWDKFHNGCPGCQRLENCSCSNSATAINGRAPDTNAKTTMPLFEKLPKPKTVPQWQAFFERLYGTSNRRLPPIGLFGRLVEDVGDVSRLLRLRASRDTIGPKLASIFAWLIGLCNRYGAVYGADTGTFSLDELLWEKYGDGCPKCRKSPCVCAKPLGRLVTVVCSPAASHAEVSETVQALFGEEYVEELVLADGPHLPAGTPEVLGRSDAVIVLLGAKDVWNDALSQLASWATALRKPTLVFVPALRADEDEGQTVSGPGVLRSELLDLLQYERTDDVARLARERLASKGLLLALRGSGGRAFDRSRRSIPRLAGASPSKSLEDRILTAPDFKSARKILDEMLSGQFKPTRSLFSTMIEKATNFREAEKLVRDLREYDLYPDLFVCKRIVDLAPDYTRAKDWVDRQVQENNLQSDITIENALKDKGIRELDADLTTLRGELLESKGSTDARLSEVVLRRLGLEGTAKPHHLSGKAARGLLWEVVLPNVGLQFTSGRALLLIRKEKLDRSFYQLLGQLARELVVPCVFVVDVRKMISPPQAPGTELVWITADHLLELANLSGEDRVEYLARLVTSQAYIENYLPYKTEGPIGEEMFFGREDELRKLLAQPPKGGLILGGHKSGKTSLLRKLSAELKAKHRRYRVLPIMSVGDIPNHEVFLQIATNTYDESMPAPHTVAGWGQTLRRRRRRRPVVFLIDEYDNLLQFDEAQGYALGREMRALQNDGYCCFYLAGHSRLRRAMTTEESPYFNMAPEVVLTGLSVRAAEMLIKEPIRDFGYRVSDEQTESISSGTGRIPVLLQQLCRKLLLGLHGKIEPDIPDGLLDGISRSPTYQEEVLMYFKYGLDAVGLCVLYALASQINCTLPEIQRQLGDAGLELRGFRLRKALSYLMFFGLAEQDQDGTIGIMPRHLQTAIAVRNPSALLREEVQSLKEEADDLSG